MARLGELLVAAGLLTAEQLEQALRAQVMWGARLGTNLVELGFIDLDALSSALAQQHRLPAALERHFERVDPELQGKLSPRTAEMFSCLPVMRVGPRRQIVLAASSPLTKKAIAIIAEELGVGPELMIPAIAAELRIRYQLERVYNLTRSARFMRSPGKTIPPFPAFVIEEADAESDPDILLIPTSQDDGAPAHIVHDAEVTMPFKAVAEATPPAPAASEPDDELDLFDTIANVSLDELDETPAEPPTDTDDAAGRERRTYVRTIADDGGAAAPEQQQLGRIAIRRVAIAVDPERAEGATLAEATRVIRRAKDRDRVADLAVAALFRFAPACEAAVFLVVRGQVATAWKGFNRNGAPTPELGVPLDQPGLVPRAVSTNATTASPASDLAPIDQLLMVSLGQQRGELAVVPVAIGGQVMCVLAMVSGGPCVETAEAIAAATGAAFARLIRDAAR